MVLSDLAVTRPVMASVFSLLLIVFGLFAFDRLPLREYPDIDLPIVSINTSYPGAAANVVETRITKPIEDRIAGVEGVESISSISRDGESRITVEFTTGRDIDAAANDVRDRVAGIIDVLPDEASRPDITKADSNDDVILWLNLTSDWMSLPELTDYANRYVVDRFSVLDGVSRVRLGGSKTYAMRVWLDRDALAARNLTAVDVENALRAENIELPAGSIESQDRQFTVRLDRPFATADEVAGIVLADGGDGSDYLVRVGDVARVEIGTEEERSLFRSNGQPMVGIGIIKQSTANVLAVADAVLAEMAQVEATLPDGLNIATSYDSTVFVDGAVKEVYKTLAIALVLVVIVIFLFLGSLRATLVPTVTIPVAIIATFIMLWAFGFTINLLTLLALVLAIGLVVDDSIVILENIYRRMDEKAETRLIAAHDGARQVGFAVIATTLVLIAVFVPISFLEGNLGRLFREFALTMAAAVGFSTLVALTLSPMLASKLLVRNARKSLVGRGSDRCLLWLRGIYGALLRRAIRHRWLVVALMLVVVALGALLYRALPSEYAPREDRGTFFIIVDGPEGATYDYMAAYMDEIEQRLTPLIDSGDINRLLIRSPRAFGNTEIFNTGSATVVLNDWGERRSSWEIMDDVRERLADLPGVRAVPVMRQGFGGGSQRPVRFVIGGDTYEQLAEWRDILLAEIDKDNPGLIGLDHDYKETRPQLRVVIDYDRAADLGVTVTEIGRTLETMLGGRAVTTYIDDGEEYDIILEGERSAQNTPDSLQNIYVRSDRTGQLIPLSNVVSLEESAGSTTLNRFNRIRAITLDANLSDDLSLGEALDYLEGLVDEHLPAGAIIDYKGQSADFKKSGGSIIFVLFAGILVAFLVLAAQFESYVHPFVIMVTVPLAMAGALVGLYLTGQSLNLYSQIGLIVLVGLAAKNGILIVEFVNQLRDSGRSFDDAIVEGAELRLRPIIITAITTIAGSLPLILASGAGSETRLVVGIVLFWGVAAATLFTLFVVPIAYSILARRTGSPGDVKRRLDAERTDTGGSV
ncbi:MAG: efflux RND transporter permease subunit [Pseudomonadota bacterium]